MIDLKNLEEIKKLDPKDVYGSTGMLADQCNQIWTDSKNVNFPGEYSKAKNIVLCGMGGSAYGGQVVLSLFKRDLNVPLYVNNDYTLPGFVDSSTLVILVSYSGSTEEVLSCAQKAKEKGAKITGLTNGKGVGKFLAKNNLPGIIFEQKFNPCGQPRLGTGYVIFGTIAILNRIGLLSIADQEIKKATDELRASIMQIKEMAMEISQNIQGKIPIIMASEFLVGNAHVMRNQFNETAKNFASYSPLPELNHHLLEGLKNPPDKKIAVILLKSGMYSDVIKKRIMLTEDVVKKNNIETIEYSPAGSIKISQALNTLSFGGYLTLYLALLYGLDPSLIPWVDYFKEQLAK